MWNATAITQAQGSARHHADAHSTASKPRSVPGVLGSLLLLLALPLAIVFSNVVGGDDSAETFVHFALAAAFALISLAAFDFKAPRWAAWAGSVAMAGLAAVFLIQGVSNVVAGDALHRLVFDVLGQEFESALAYLFIVWCVAMLLADSRGRTKVFGVIVMSVLVAAEVYALADASAPEALKLLSLPPFLWLLLESRKASNEESSR